MRRIFRLFRPAQPAPAAVWTLSAEQHAQVMQALSEIGLAIVAETRGPVPLMTFGRRVLDRLGQRRPFVDPVPLPHFADALKAVIKDMDHDRLRVMSPTDFPGVGYVFNVADPETWPVRTSR